MTSTAIPAAITTAYPTNPNITADIRYRLATGGDLLSPCKENTHSYTLVNLMYIMTN